MLEGVIHLNLQSTPMQSCSVFVVGIIQQHSPHIYSCHLAGTHTL